MKNAASAEFMQPDAIPPSVEPLSWPTWITLAWAGGMIALVARSGFRYRQFIRQIPPPLAADDAWIAEWEAVHEESGIRSRATLHATEQLGPMICRFPNGYRLLAPVELWRGLQPGQRRAILRHELAHLQRHDVWKSLAVRVLALPQWFNPLAWRLVRRFDDYAEIACDHAACQDSPHRAADYARALLRLGETSRGSMLLRSGVRSGRLADRVRRVLQPTFREDSTMKKGLVFALLLGLTLCGMLQFQLTADEPGKAAEPQSSARTAPRQRDGRRLDRRSGREAVIDIAYLFRNLEEFEREREKLKSETARRQQTMKEATDDLMKLHRELAGKVDGAVKERIEREIARKKAEMEAERAIATKEFRQREVEIYQETYERITKEVARYAKAHQIRLVRRADLSSQRDKQVDKSADPQEIIKRLNQDIVYIEREEFDITDAILERLSASDVRQGRIAAP